MSGKAMCIITKMTSSFLMLKLQFSCHSGLVASAYALVSTDYNMTGSSLLKTEVYGCLTVAVFHLQVLFFKSKRTMESYQQKYIVAPTLCCLFFKVFWKSLTCHFRFLKSTFSISGCRRHLISKLPLNDRLTRVWKLASVFELWKITTFFALLKNFAIRRWS